MHQPQFDELDGTQEGFLDSPPNERAMLDSQTTAASLVSGPHTQNFPGFAGLANQVKLLDVNSK